MDNSFHDLGKFGKYGGKFIPETLVPAINELESAYERYKNEPSFNQELGYYRTKFAGRPTPLYFAKNLTEYPGGSKIYLKREDLLHGGAHKTNNTLGQALLAKRMGKKRVIAETGSWPAWRRDCDCMCSLKLQCEIYMGARDMERQKPNVFRMKLLGAKVHAVKTGSRTLKDAINEALRDWISSVQETYYLIGLVVGPIPYPTMVRDFQSIIGSEIKTQIHDYSSRLPDVIVACVGGGSNAIGSFYQFIQLQSHLWLESKQEERAKLGVALRQLVGWFRRNLYMECRHTSYKIKMGRFLVRTAYRLVWITPAWALSMLILKTPKK